MKVLQRAAFALKAARQMGISKLTLLAIYKSGVTLGVFQWLTHQPADQQGSFPFALPWKVPERNQIIAILGPNWQNTLQEADDICRGKYRRYGASPLPLQLVPREPLLHWSQLEIHPDDGQDIKDTWEDARLGWVFILGRAYLLSSDEKYACAFWQLVEQFIQSNPPYLGPNWISAQEAAFRIIAMCIARVIFLGSKESTSSRLSILDTAILHHAQRVPPTLIYARSQANNHLLSEAAGLITAALSFPSHPQASKWLHLGIKWFHAGIQTQVQPDGSYNQQSTNYHRLMLHLALWVKTICDTSGKEFPDISLDRLSAATRWLSSCMDSLSGRVNNLGHNDGSLLFPLDSQPRHDFRPTIQAAGLSFLNQTICPPGGWDEFALWMGCSPQPRYTQPLLQSDKYRLGDTKTWGSIRAVHFTDRPAHADQLHVDLWWQGVNIAMDPGTYRYSTRPPWNNALAGTGTHNTLTLFGMDQMLIAGRFLWLDWAQAKNLPPEEPNAITAEHDGYRQFGITHRRTLSHPSNLGWKVVDRLFYSGRKNKSVTGRLHWLVPDWQWRLSGTNLSLQGHLGQVRVRVFTEKQGLASTINVHYVQLVRAGEVIFGPPDEMPVLGWYSPTYSQVIPALSFCVNFSANLPCTITTHWTLGNTSILQKG